MFVMIDGFLPSPDLMRQDALRAAYAKGHVVRSNVIYGYSQVPGPRAHRIVEALSRQFGDHLRDTFVDAYYGIYPKADEIESRRRNAWIHYDRFRMIAIIYLNPNEQCSGGTTMYCHRATGVSRWEQLYSLGETEIRQTKLDSGNDSAWDVVSHSEMRYNRLVVFDPRHFHQAPHFFGDRPDNSRLTINFVFGSVDQRDNLTRRVSAYVHSKEDAS